jgi:hypothetical protein
MRLRPIPVVATLLVLAACGPEPPPVTEPPAAAASSVAPAPGRAASDGDPRAPVAGRVLGSVVHAHDAEELRYLILAPLVRRYADANRIDVTPTETDAYVAHLRSALREDRERWVARRDELAQRVAAGGLPVQQRDAFATELDELNTIIAGLAEAPAAGESAEGDEAARREIAAAFILQWKINRALYRQYGGRIIFQQGGPEPLDAYLRFLEEARARGDFEIPDRALEAAFWHYYRSEDIHSFFAPGSVEEARAFDMPPWLPSR